MIIDSVIEGYFVKRYKRFFVDIRLKETQEIVTAHCPNPGAMLGLLVIDSPLLLTLSSNPKRKLAYTFQAVQIDNTWVGVNTSLPNELVAKALANQQISLLKDYTGFQREVKYGANSRVDFLLTKDGKPSCYVEVKNVHLKRLDYAEFPDCVTARGAKHLNELGTLMEQGYRCIMVYVIQRNDCKEFKLAADLDPAYSQAAEKAQLKGVETINLTYGLSYKNSQLIFHLENISL